MKNTTGQKNNKITLIAVVLLFVLLCVLTVATINVFLNSSSVKDTVPFDLDRITVDKTAEYIDVSSALVPSFIGITSDGTGYGVSVSANTVAELYKTVTPVLADVLVDEYASVGDNALWNSLADVNDSVYVRYHNDIPDYVISVFADASNYSENSFNSYVSEMLLMPYSEAFDTITVATRSSDGSVTVFEKNSPEEIITVDDLRKILRSYRSNLTEFEFVGDNSVVESVTEPIFIDSIVTRNIITTGNSGMLIQNGTEDFYTLLRLFSINPDKLLNQHTEDDGSMSCIDTKGVLYLSESSFEYTAAVDGGIHVEEFIGYIDNIGFMDYVQAALKIFTEIRSINRNCAGGDADISLSSVEALDGKVSLTFDYVFDNLKITDIEHAFSVTFENEVLTEAKLFNLAVKNFGDRNELSKEWWFMEFVKRKMSPGDKPYRCIEPVYRADYVSDSIKAEWRAE